MTDKQTNLHPKNDSSVNLKPNIITGNIPDKAVTLEKLDPNLQNTLNNFATSITTNRAQIEKKIGEGHWVHDDSQISLDWFPSDLNNVLDNKTFYIDNDLSLVSNLPINESGLLISIKEVYSTGIFIVTQIYITDSAETFIRTCKCKNDENKEWSQWRTEKTSNTIHIKTSDIPNLFEILQYCFTRGNMNVYFEEGTYDLSPYIETFYNKRQEGLLFGNGCKYYFSSNSKVIANYTGSNHLVMENWSIVGADVVGDFEIHNMTAEAKRIRYIVHDENGGVTNHIGIYRHIYDNCHFTLDNTGSISANPTCHCIGGGLGDEGEIIIRNCYFNSVYQVSTDHADVSYHGSWDSNQTDSKCNIIVTGNYFANAFRLSNPNPEKQKHYVMYNNNSAKTDIVMNQTTLDNWEIVKFNNEIRG